MTAVAKPAMTPVPVVGAAVICEAGNGWRGLGEGALLATRRTPVKPTASAVHANGRSSSGCEKLTDCQNFIAGTRRRTRNSGPSGPGRHTATTASTGLRSPLTCVPPAR